MIENTVINPAKRTNYDDVFRKISKVTNKSLDVTNTFREDNQRFKRCITKTSNQIKKQSECSLIIKEKINKTNSKLRFYTRMYNGAGLIIVLFIVADLLFH